LYCTPEELSLIMGEGEGQPSTASTSDGSERRAYTTPTVRATIGSLDDDARLILRGLGNASAALEEAARRILGPRLTADELEELERMRVFALKILSRLTPEELAELLAILAVRRAP
jgi:hypothetical protein